MPSPTAALSAGLRFSLVGSTHKGKEGNGEQDNIDFALASGNKLAEVTKHVVEYQPAECQQTSTQNVLKSKYIVLDAKHTPVAAHVSGIKSLNGMSSNGTKDLSCSNGSGVNGFNKCISNGSANNLSNGPHLNGVKGVHQNGLTNANTNGIHKNTMTVGSIGSNGIKRLGMNGFSKGAGDEKGGSKSPANCESTLPEPRTVLYDPEKVVLGWRTNTRPGAGMFNTGNTCYLNSTLQALFHVPAFVEWLLSDTEHMKKCEQINGSLYGDCVTCAMAKTLRASQTSNVIKPFLITNKLKMICRHMCHGAQEDAHEFLRHLLENMEKAYVARCKAQKLDAYSKETTPINQIFGGYIRTEVKCLKCNYASTTFQHIQDLILDIRSVSKVDDAIDRYFSKESLDGENSYKCEKCKTMVAASKKFSIERPPKVLCIQLKRFRGDGLKLSKAVELRTNMDLRRHVHPQSSYAKYASLPYRLIAMVTHVGSSASCGHYTAIAQCGAKSFYQFDDQCVRPVQMHTVLQNCAYILIYEMVPEVLRTNVKPAASPAIASIPTLGNNNHIMNGFSKVASGIHGALPSANDRDRVTFGMTSSTHSRIVIHSKKADSNSLVPPVKAPGVPNGSLMKEARAANFIGPIQVTANGKHPGSPVVKDKTSVPGISKLLDNNNLSRKDLSLPNKVTENERRHTGSLVPYECDDDSSSRESSLSPPLSEEVLTVKATTPSDWQVTNSSGLRSPSIHSESSNHSVASATGANWNVTETQSVCSKSVASQNAKDMKVIETSSQTMRYSSDLELSQSAKSAGLNPLREKSIERAFNLSDNMPSFKGTKMNRVRRSSVSSESDSSASKVSKKKLKVFGRTEDCGMSKQSDKSVKKEPNTESRFTHSEVSGRNADSLNNSFQRTNSGTSTWNGDSNSSTVNDLLKMSHQGFGNERVSSWNGEQSQVERSVEKDRQSSRKRTRDEYEMELDRGRLKKMKMEHFKNFKSKWRPYPPYGQYTNYNSNRRYHDSVYSHNKFKNRPQENVYKKWGENMSYRYTRSYI